jgi:membrane protease YdiL (CAAX protease family)
MKRQHMASHKFGETKGPLVICLLFTTYMVLLVTVLAPLVTVTELTVVNLVIQAAEVYGVLLAFLVIILALREKRRNFREISSSLGLKRQGAGRSVFWSLALFPLCIAFGFISMILSYLAGPASIFISNGHELPAWYFWYLIVQSFFPVAVVEEAAGRGYMLDRLMPEHPSSIAKALPAILLSSLLFTLFHVPTYLGGSVLLIPRALVLLTLNVFPISVILGVAYVRARTRNIIGPVIVHFLLDAIPPILTLVTAQFALTV